MMEVSPRPSIFGWVCFSMCADFGWWVEIWFWIATTKMNASSIALGIIYFVIAGIELFTTGVSIMVSRISPNNDIQIEMPMLRNRCRCGV